MIASRPAVRHPSHRAVLAMLCAASLLAPIAAAGADTSPAQQLARFAAEAGAPGDPARGRAFFTTRQGGEWSCASCHGATPTVAGRHAGTGRTIEPLAPAARPAAFTDAAKVDKWFRRNCRDVAARECTAGEKADVVAWLITLRP
jgi:hypothetical protein